MSAFSYETHSTNTTRELYEYDIRREALTQALRQTRDNSKPEDVVAVAEIFYRFLKGK